MLYTIPNLKTAGSGRALFEVARRLDRDRFEAVLGVTDPGGRLHEEAEAVGLKVVDLSICGGPTVAARPLVGLPWRAWRVGRSIRRRHGRFDVWHSYHYLDDYTEPWVARAAGARAWIFTKKNMLWNRRAWWLRSLFATRVAAQNHDMLERFFAERWLRPKTVLLPRGVDTERFRVEGPRDDALRAWAGGDPLVVAVAHLVPVKGFTTLIDAVARLPRVRLAIAGRADDRAYASGLERQIEAAGLGERIRLLGSVGDVPRLLRTADCFVLPTRDRDGDRAEGCPVALLEAMAMAKPVIATDIPGSRDVVVDGESGRLVPPEDADELASALAELIDDPAGRRRLGQAARHRIETGYAIEREVRDHEQLYSGLSL
ncbi:MAG: glycosyltransferase [Acidobacteriota bacterium]